MSKHLKLRLDKETGMAVTSAIAFMLLIATSPGSSYVRPTTQIGTPASSYVRPTTQRGTPALQQSRRRQQRVLRAPSPVGHTAYWHLQSGLSATLSVCTEEDCLQQGAPQTLAKLRKKAAERRNVTVCYLVSGRTALL